MKDFNALQNLWDEQKMAALPDSASILFNAKKTQHALNNKIKKQVAVLLFVVVVMLILVNVIPFKKATTFIGMGIMIVSVLLFSAMRLVQIIRLHKIDLTQNPRQLLIKLEAYHVFQNTINTQYTFIYYILMNLAFALYFIEVLNPIQPFFRGVIIIVYLVWMLFAYLYLGKKHKKKEHAKTQSIIDAIKAIEQQYEI